MNSLQEKEELLVQCENDLKKIREIHKEIKKIESNRVELHDYYLNQYIKDYEAPQNKGCFLRILDQDSIWNVLDDQYRAKINLIQTIIKSI